MDASRFKTLVIVVGSRSTELADTHTISFLPRRELRKRKPSLIRWENGRKRCQSGWQGTGSGAGRFTFSRSLAAEAVFLLRTKLFSRSVVLLPATRKTKLQPSVCGS